MWSARASVKLVVERGVADKHPVVDGSVKDVDGHLQVDVLSKLAALDAELEYLPGLRPPYREPARTKRLGKLRVRSDPRLSRRPPSALSCR